MTARALRPLLLAPLLAAVGAGLAGCETSGGLPPTQVVRYHLDQPISRGTVVVQPLLPAAAGSLAFAPYAAAVQAQLAQLGYTPAAAGALPDYVATVDLKQDQQVGPPRRSPISIGIGAGGYSGGYRDGGVGLGGGIGFPIGGGGRRAILVSELSVTIKHRVDQISLWEGHARRVADARAPDATADGQAARLASALFSGFPGQSGRTIEVR